MKTRRTVKLPMLFVCILAYATLLATESKPDEPPEAAPPASDSLPGKKAGEVRDDNGLKMKLVWCPPGFVTMEQIGQVGQVEQSAINDDEDLDQIDPEDRPAHSKSESSKNITPVKVFVTRGYWLAKYEVTQSEWRQVMATEPWKGQRRFPVKEGIDFPATWITWDDAMEFCRMLTGRERDAGRLPAGWVYTLPTEAQWERACRGRTETKFSFGDDESKLGEHGWFLANARDAGESYAHQVGQKKPNPWGLCDMHGNVSEWCRDWYTERLPGGRDPEVLQGGPFRVHRGGGWCHAAAVCGSATRYGFGPSDRNSDLGFRVAVSASRNK
jgi:formylglycine-generating enzyme required for sulfatase activity